MLKKTKKKNYIIIELIIYLTILIIIFKNLKIFNKILLKKV